MSSSPLLIVPNHNNSSSLKFNDDNNNIDEKQSEVCNGQPSHVNEQHHALHNGKAHHTNGKSRSSQSSCTDSEPEQSHAHQYSNEAFQADNGVMSNLLNSIASSNPATSVLRKFVSPPASGPPKMSSEAHQDQSAYSSAELPSFSSTDRFKDYESGRGVEYQKLINCEDVEIERHQPGRNRSSVISLVNHLFTCSPYVSKFLSAIFYATASFFIVVINKIVLTNYK